MANLTYNTENKRIATTNESSATVLPTEDTENERITLTSTDTPVVPEILFESSGDGFYTVKDRSITEEYIDPQTLGLTIDNDGYASIPE